MPKLPRVSGADVIRALAKLGFIEVRHRGSHVVLKRTDSSVREDVSFRCTPNSPQVRFVAC